MIKLRLCFTKTGPLRYIGHLDFLKVFQQTIRRAGLPVAYSQGFNPHIQLSFALPLPLGMTSANDYADLTLKHEMQEAKLLSNFNANAPDGLVLSSAKPFSGAGAAALATAADYFLFTDIDASKAIDCILSKESIVIPKKTKSGVKDTDIRPDIFHISKEDNHILMRLAAGSGRFLNPLVVAKLLINEDASPSSIIRNELYSQDNDKGLVPLYETSVH